MRTQWEMGDVRTTQPVQEDSFTIGICTETIISNKCSGLQVIAYQ